MMGPANSYVLSIHVADAGVAVVAALTVPAGTYNVVDDEPLTKRNYADALAAAAGKAAWLRIPGPSGAHAGKSFNVVDSLLTCQQCSFPASQWLEAQVSHCMARMDGHRRGSPKA